jgi:hypothetical protein
MKLSPNVGSDRSWVWNAAADVSEGEPEAQTLAIRFANSESKSSFERVLQKSNAFDRRQFVQGGFHQGSTRERGSVRHSIIDSPPLIQHNGISPAPPFMITNSRHPLLHDEPCP